MGGTRIVQVYEELHCPFCGSTEIYCEEEDYNYKAGFWGGVFLNLIGALLCGFFCRKRTIAHCNYCGSNFSYYEEECV